MELLDVTEGDRIGTKNEEWFFSPEDLRGFNKEEPSYFMPVGRPYVIVVEMNNSPQRGDFVHCPSPSLSWRSWRLLTCSQNSVSVG